MRNKLIALSVPCIPVLLAYNNMEIKIHCVFKIGFPTHSVALKTKIRFPGLKKKKKCAKENNQSREEVIAKRKQIVKVH